MKPSNLMQANANKSYKNEALNGANLEAHPSNSISPWFVALASVSALSIGVMLLVGVPKNIKENYFAAPQIVHEQEVAVQAKFMDAFIWTTKLKLEDLKLNHRLQVSASAANELEIKGNISKQEAKNWKAFLDWYEGKDGFPKLNHYVEASATSSNIPELKSVWFDTKPTAYFTDGRSGNIGTSFEDGWEIVSIEAWAVFVQRNGTTVMLQY